MHTLSFPDTYYGVVGWVGFGVEEGLVKVLIKLTMVELRVMMWR